MGFHLHEQELFPVMADHGTRNESWYSNEAGGKVTIIEYATTPHNAGETLLKISEGADTQTVALTEATWDALQHAMALHERRPLTGGLI